MSVRDESKRIIERRGETERVRGLVTAFQDVTDGVLDFARTHVDLAKAEARTELNRAKRDAVLSGIGGGLVLLGGGTLSLFLILGAGAIGSLTSESPMIGGIVAMALTSLILSIVYATVGLRILRPAMRRLQDEKLHHTKSEIKRSSEWVKEIAESS